MTPAIRLIPLLVLASCRPGADSENTILKQITNRDRSKKAILFVKEAGATVADSYQVTISEAGYNLSKKERGNVFIIDDNHGVAPLDTSSISITWLSNDCLKISYDRKLRTFIKVDRMNGINILYASR